tara:strand:+ start:90 stop:269 length:180 start_codon:yes stop_codon:yes gene_type:complete
MRAYTKSIVTAIATVITVVTAIVRGDAPETIPGATEALIGLITTALVFLLPNIPKGPRI